MIGRGLTSRNQYSCGSQRRFAGVLTSYFLSGIIVLEKDPVDSGLINAPKKHDTGRNSDGKHDGKVDKLEFSGLKTVPLTRSKVFEDELFRQHFSLSQP